MPARRRSRERPRVLCLVRRMLVPQMQQANKLTRTGGESGTTTSNSRVAES